MTVLFQDGFESGDFSAWSGTNGSPAIVTSPVHHGSCTERATSTGAWAKTVCYKTISPAQSTIFVRAYVRFTDMPNTHILAIATHWWQSYGWWAGIKKQATNDYRWCLMRNTGVEYISSSNIGDVTGAWICMEMKVVISSTDGEVRLWINGTEVIAQTGLDTGTTNTDMVSAGVLCWADNQITTVYVDCFVAADTYIGPEGQTYEINVDAICQSLATPAYETTYNISKDASVTSQSLHAQETTFNILKDAVVKTSATTACEVTFTLPVDAVVKAYVLSTLGSTFHISQEAHINVLAEVTVLKPTEVKITKLFLIIGDLAIQIQGD